MESETTSGSGDCLVSAFGAGEDRRKVQGAIMEYMICENHPAKSALDALFRSSRATETEALFEAAGFRTLFRQERSFIRVASHQLVPGYILKLYLDSEQRQKHNRPGWQWLIRRCEGAARIRRTIQQQGIRHFRVPNKWLYPLPARSHPLSEPFLLLVEDMGLVSRKENTEAWKTLITPEHLKELYIIIREAGGGSYRPANIWLMKQGEFAFIDTEYPQQKFDYQSISGYLSSAGCKYWTTLVGGAQG
jgi:hypothetical protein